MAATEGESVMGRLQFMNQDGEWDWDDLANNWDEQLLTEWGLDIPNFDSGGFADQNKELSLDDVSDSMTITLKYTEDEYHLV